jgi:hypothetical protein
MSTRRSVLALAVAAAVLAGCGSGDDAAGGAVPANVEGSVVAVGDAVVAVGAAPAPLPTDGVGSIGDAVEVAAGAPGEAADAACTLDRQALEAAAETYELLNGAPATSQQELVDAQMIREPSVRFDIAADGTVVPAPGSPCV